MKPVSRRWTFDENAELNRLLDAGKEAGEIAVALSRTRPGAAATALQKRRKGSQNGWRSA